MWADKPFVKWVPRGMIRNWSALLLLMFWQNNTSLSWSATHKDNSFHCTKPDLFWTEHTLDFIFFLISHDRLNTLDFIFFSISHDRFKYEKWHGMYDMAWYHSSSSNMSTRWTGPICGITGATGLVTPKNIWGHDSNQIINVTFKSFSIYHNKK